MAEFKTYMQENTSLRKETQIHSEVLEMCKSQWMFHFLIVKFAFVAMIKGEELLSFEACFNDAEFSHVPELRNFDQAARACRDRGASLARIDNREEFDFVLTLLELAVPQGENVWIGNAFTSVCEY